MTSTRPRTPGPATGGRFGGLGLTARMFTAMALVIAAGAVTLLAVALLLAPEVFGSHLHRRGVPAVTPALQTHLDQAFAQAIGGSLAVGVLVSVITAALVTWLISRRLAASVADLARTATRLAYGHYDAQVPDPGLGPEFASLAGAVNELALRLGRSEEIRHRLLADLGHELRTPLASLEATVEAVADGVLPVDTTTLDTLTDQTARLRRLVNDLESVSRAEERQLALNPRPVTLRAVADRAVAVLRARYDAKGVPLLREDHGPDPMVLADDDRLVEALMNLLDNALRHTPPTGTVTVAVRADAVRADATATGRPGPPTATLTVTDTGTGFDPAEGPRLFERFYRSGQHRAGAGPSGDGGGRTAGDAAPVGQPLQPPPQDRRAEGRAGNHGSGIGLTITRAIIETHHGTITASSPGTGLGASFTISLPVSATPSTKVSATASTKPVKARPGTSNATVSNPTQPRQ
jgi:two-component system sensor histidine kinase BaeS